MSDYSELKRLAEAATPQNFESAEEKVENGYIECPHCGGSGEVELEADYCNYDNAAIGVQFYGIGHEFGAAEAYYRAANPAAVLALIADVEFLEESRKEARDERNRFGDQLDAAELKIEQLKAEVEAFKEANHRISEVNNSRRNHLNNAKKAAGIGPLDDLVGAVEAMRKDAERYRWLRMHGQEQRRIKLWTALQVMDDNIDEELDKESSQ